MPMFNVEAVDNQGKRIKTQIDAATANDAIMKVKVRGYKPMSVKEAKPDGAAAVAAPAKTAAAANPSTSHTPPPTAAKTEPPRPSAGAPVAKKKGGGIRIPFLSGGVTFKMLTQFTHQFSVLMEAGLPIVRSLKILANQQKPGILKDITEQVSEDVETGSTLSEALSKHPKAFDKLYVNMVRAGEAGGVLEEVLKRLSEFMEKAMALRRKVIGASIYPIVVISIALVVVWAIMTFIVPRFAEVFKSVGVAMPGMTLFLISTSNFLGTYWFVPILLPIVLFVLYKAWAKTKSGRMMVDRIKLKTPIVGMVIKKTVTARFCRTLGTLLKSGVPILEALNIVKNATGNEVVAEAIGKVHDSVREGESIVEPLSACGIFDDIVVNMIDVGEETGELDSMLLKIAEIYDQEVDAAVAALVSVMEPLLIVGLGATVGFIVVALFLPLVSLLSGLTQKRGQ